MLYSGVPSQKHSKAEDSKESLKAAQGGTNL